MTVPALRAMCAALAIVGCSAGCAVKKPSPIRAVFLIVVDTLRPDRLSCYGYDGHRTAAIDRIAASGVRFEHAESPASWTLPSMGSMLTSRYPTQLGLVESPPEGDAPFAWREKRKQVRYTLPDGVPTLASLLDDAGFYPIAFVNQPFINADRGFMQGFARWCFSTGEDSIAWHDPAEPVPTIDYPPGTDLANADPLLVAEFKTWLAKNADVRPFVWLHLLRPHWPYTPLLGDLPEADRRPGVAVPPAMAYTAEVREADDMVGDILDAIDASVGLEHALVILTSDHGEEFGDHGMAEHGHSMHREVVQVPLILAGPSLRAGTTVRGFVTTLDLTPTVLELVGVKGAAHANFEGRSLLRWLGKNGGDEAIYSEGMLYGSTERSVIQGRYKLMFDVQAKPAYALYDLERDPLETTDVRAKEPARAAAMEQALRAHAARMVDDYATFVGSKAVEENPETQRILKAMRTLGYVSD